MMFSHIYHTLLIMGCKVSNFSWFNIFFFIEFRANSANVNSVQTVLYFFLLRLYKESPCTIFWLCAGFFFHNCYSFKTILCFIFCYFTSWTSYPWQVLEWTLTNYIVFQLLILFSIAKYKYIFHLYCLETTKEQLNGSVVVPVSKPGPNLLHVCQQGTYIVC